MFYSGKFSLCDVKKIKGNREKESFLLQIALPSNEQSVHLVEFSNKMYNNYA